MICTFATAHIFAHSLQFPFWKAEQRKKASKGSIRKGDVQQIINRREKQPESISYCLSNMRSHTSSCQLFDLYSQEETIDVSEIANNLPCDRPDSASSGARNAGVPSKRDSISFFQDVGQTSIYGEQLAWSDDPCQESHIAFCPHEAIDISDYDPDEEIDVSSSYEPSCIEPSCSSDNLPEIMGVAGQEKQETKGVPFIVRASIKRDSFSVDPFDKFQGYRPSKRVRSVPCA